MRLRIGVALSLWILFSPLFGWSEGPSVRLATLNWEPYIGENLEAYGFGADILRRAFRKAGYTVRFSFVPWVRALKDTEIGHYDAACFAYHSEERAKDYLFSEPYAASRLGFVSLRGAGIDIRTLRDLTPYRIGVVRGFVNTPEFDSLQTLHKEEAKNESANLKKLLNGRVDLIVIDEFVLQHLMERHFPHKKKEVVFLEPPLAVQPLHLIFSKRLETSAGLVRDFNRAIAEMEGAGAIDAILRRHGYDHGR